MTNQNYTMLSLCQI